MGLLTKLMPLEEFRKAKLFEEFDEYTMEVTDDVALMTNFNQRRYDHYQMDLDFIPYFYPQLYKIMRNRAYKVLIVQTENGLVCLYLKEYKKNNFWFFDLYGIGISSSGRFEESVFVTNIFLRKNIVRRFHASERDEKVFGLEKIYVKAKPERTTFKSYPLEFRPRKIEALRLGKVENMIIEKMDDGSFRKIVPEDLSQVENLISQWKEDKRKNGESIRKDSLIAHATNHIFANQLFDFFGLFERNKLVAFSALCYLGQGNCYLGILISQRNRFKTIGTPNLDWNLLGPIMEASAARMLFIYNIFKALDYGRDCLFLDSEVPSFPLERLLLKTKYSTSIGKIKSYRTNNSFSLLPTTKTLTMALGS